MKKLTTTPFYRDTSFQAVPVPSSKEIKTLTEQFSESGKFRLFGKGNERRDMVLLLRGDLRLLQTADTSFIGCIYCGAISRKVLINSEGAACCSSCGQSDGAYFFDGAYSNCHARVEIGCRDLSVKIEKL